MGKLTHAKLIDVLIEIARPQGFFLQGNELQRSRGDFLDCISIQMRSDSAAFAVNLGIHPRFMLNGNEPELREVDCTIRRRLAPNGEADYWISSAGLVEDIQNELRSIFLKQEENFFSVFTTLHDVAKILSVDNIKSSETPSCFDGMTRVRRVLLAAKIHAEIGENQSARQLADFGLSVAGVAVGPKKEFKALIEKLSNSA